ncbi:MAG: hypothetical protein EPO52_16075 [Herbiconiux sp.]|uniref:hypothetical protein n=1 Tax=Herbiconiux sp. TaxID=1871186 RepID=UPI0012097D70|nr:hypothetical protein [Herbiconiux sp.]TAJ46073.1 MAG: hypothetical protein EPO52_16075 [Herbiconiux sp.]
MIGIWTLLISLALLAITITAAVICFRSGNRIAIVLGLDSALIAALGILLNSATRGELSWLDLLIFGALPIVFAVIGVLISLRRTDQDERYTTAAH